MKNNYFTYYDLLGVDPNASQEEILKAFKVKAKEHHPDKNQGNHSSNTLFQYLQSAREVLTDPETRQEYDYAIGIKDRPGSANNSPSGSFSNSQKIIGGALVGLIVGLAIGSLTQNTKS